MPTLTFLFNQTWLKFRLTWRSKFLHTGLFINRVLDRLLKNWVSYHQMPTGTSTRGHFKEKGPPEWIYCFSMPAQNSDPGEAPMYSQDPKNGED